MQIRRCVSGAVAACALALAAGASAAAGELRLIMFEQAGCHYCARWDEEIGPIWPKTDEGRAAPLQRIDIHRPLPEGIELQRRPVFTPTFVLVEDGREVGRLEGYAGEDFFWPLVGNLLQQAGVRSE